MSEMKTPIKTLNGHKLVDTDAQARLSELSEEKLDKTHFDAETIPLTIDGYVDSGNGTVTTSTSAKCTDFIDIVGAKEIDYKSRISSSGSIVAFYDSEKIVH